jgi:hypothetical protein
VILVFVLCNVEDKENVPIKGVFVTMNGVVLIVGLNYVLKIAIKKEIASLVYVHVSPVIEVLLVKNKFALMNVQAMDHAIIMNVIVLQIGDKLIAV